MRGNLIVSAILIISFLIPLAFGGKCCCYYNNQNECADCFIVNGNQCPDTELCSSSNAPDCTASNCGSTTTCLGKTYYCCRVGDNSYAWLDSPCSLPCTSAPVCMRSNPTVSISPSSQNGSVEVYLYYTVSVYNGDSSECGPSNFSLSVTCPSGLTCSLDSSSLTISPRSSASTTLKVLASSKGTYTIKVKATNDNDPSYWGESSATADIICDKGQCIDYQGNCVNSGKCGYPSPPICYSSSSSEVPGPPSYCSNGKWIPTARVCFGSSSETCEQLGFIGSCGIAPRDCSIPCIEGLGRALSRWCILPSCETDKDCVHVYCGGYVAKCENGVCKCGRECTSTADECVDGYCCKFEITGKKRR